MIITLSMISVYYNTIIAWTLYYMGNALQCKLKLKLAPTNDNLCNSSQLVKWFFFLRNSWRKKVILGLICLFFFFFFLFFCFSVKMSYIKILTGPNAFPFYTITRPYVYPSERTLIWCPVRPLVTGNSNFIAVGEPIRIIDQMVRIIFLHF